MSGTVYLHYTQAELDRNFDQRAWARNGEEIIARCTQRSAAARARLPIRAGVSYGPSADEVLDIFPAGGPGAAVQIFVHGGAWRAFTKDDYSFAAEGFAAAGLHTVVLSFANLPAVRLPEMVSQVRRGMEWVYRNAPGFGGDPQRLYVTAHSSGAHLAAMALEGWSAAPDVPEDFVKGATLACGPYYLEPVTRSARSAYIRLTAQEVVELSPGLHASRLRCPVLLAWAEFDTDEFQRQSREFAAALRAAGRLHKAVRVAGHNHFELMEAFADPQHPLMQEILAMAGPGGEAPPFNSRSAAWPG